MRLTRTALSPLLTLAGPAIFIAIASSPAMAQGIITTAAGSTACGYSGDGGPAAAATFCGIQTPALDAAGNIYFPDGYRIRKIATDGAVSTIAGNGVQGASGDGGPALSATIGRVYQIAIYGSHLCFGDTTAYKIRCIDLGNGWIYGYGTGISGTGGDGGNISAASFMEPWGVAFDDAGNFYIADLLASSVRKVTPGGVITMFAGPGPGYSGAPLGDGGPALGANIYHPEGVYSRNGGLYIADSGNHLIRRVDLATGIISTVAGNGSTFYGAGSEGGSALDAGIVPSSLVLDPSGNLFLSSSCCMILRVDTNGIITTVADASGNGGIGPDYIPATMTVFNSIYGLGWDPVANRILISDGGSRLRQIFYTPPTTTTLTPSANPAHWGQTVTLQATVSPADATGSIRFYWGYPYSASQGSWSYLGSAPVVNGAATFTWTAPVGDATYALSAVYAGDPTHNLSQSPTVTETVQSGSSSVSLASSANPATPGQSVTFTATITPFDATGTVTFLNGGTSMGSSLVSGGVATFTTSSLPPGSNSISASYGGDSRYVASASPVLTQVIKTSTTTTLATSPNPSTYGAAVTLTATVAPSSATGAVQFFNGTALLGSANLAGGQAQISVSNLPAGSDSLTAVYGGDATNPGSASAAVTQTVNKQTPALTLTSSANPAPFAQAVTFTAALSPSQATGTVQFWDGSNALGTAPVSNGSAAVSVSTLTIGDHSIVAIYSGDASFASVSPSIVQTISKIPSSVGLSGSPNPAITGQTVTLTATVTPNAATGLVQFFEGSGILGTVAVTNGTATLTLSPDVFVFAPGAHSIIVNYNGDANYALSTSPVLTLTVLKVSTATTLAASPNPSAYGDAVTLTAAVSPAAATGVVQFLNGGALLGSASLTGGQAQLSLTGLPVGTNSITAVYGGDAGNAGSSSAAVTQTVNKQASATALSSSANPSPAGQAVVLKATVSPLQATGTVQFWDGATALGTVAVSNGSATLSVSSLAVGDHSIGASYSGDANIASSAAPPIVQTISRTSTSVTLNESPNPATTLQGVFLTAVVTPNTATGQVQFFDGATLLGSATLSGGVGSVVIYPDAYAFSVGAHSITASYSGDANDAPSTSPALTLTVVKAPTSVALGASSNPATWGQPVTFTAGVSPAAASGSIQFSDGGNLLGTVTLSGGSAVLTLPAMTPGNHSIVAAYAGNATYAASASPALIETVNQAASSTALAANPVSATVGQNVTFTATVTAPGATGTVQFLDGSSVIGAAPLGNGTAVFSTAGLPYGAHSITAAYSGDVNFKASVSATVVEQVARLSTAASLTSGPNPSTFATAVTLTAAVSPAAATGIVQFFSGSSLLGSAALAGGQAQLTVVNLPAGSLSLTAVYSGDAIYAPSTSPARIQTVNQANSKTALSASPASQAAVGDLVTLTATIAPALATGSVQFINGNKTVIGTAAVSNGVAVFSTSALASGNYNITANYLGDGNVNPSHSAAMSYKIR